MRASPKVKEILHTRLSGEEKTEGMRHLADECGIALTSLYRVFRNPSRARATTLQRIAAVLGCTVDDILETPN
jgi:DNA-binding Xre family transcriptional regulator